ncbi:hypothetical protein C8F01DRAFT_1120790 [Mycena amicta]|nr:hypothetical protein C8F01DRAFT_1120790 [Mycena amicta]
MQAPIPRWMTAFDIPLAVRLTRITTPEREVFQVTQQEPEEREPVPPIPAHLHGQECLYGFIFTEELMDAYHATHPPRLPPSESNTFSNNRLSIHAVANRLGLEIHIDHFHGRHDDVVWFSYTKGGVVRIREVPVAARLERFAEELGMTQTAAQWHNAWVPAR